MAQHSEHSTSRGARTITIYQIIAFVVPWNTAFKASRVLNTLYALHLGATPWETGLLLSMYGLFPMLFAAYAGRIIDRHGVRMPLYLGLTLLFIGVGLPFVWPSFAAIYVSAAVGGAGFILSQVSMQTLTGSLADGEARTRNFSYYLLAVATADLIGPVLAGFAIDAYGHASTFAICAVPTLISIAGFMAMDRLFPRVQRAGKEAVAQGVFSVLREKELRRVLMTSAVTMTAADLFQLYVPLYAHSVGLTASVIGLVMGAAAVAIFVTRALLPPMTRLLTEERLLMFALLLTGAMFALIPLFRSGIALGLICFVLGLGLGLCQPLTMILSFNRSPKGRAGEVVGVRVTINNFMHVVVPPVFGAAASITGLAPVLWASAGVLSLGAYMSRLRPAIKAEAP